MDRTLRISIAILSIFVAADPSFATEQSAKDEWQFSVTPYLWLPTIDGNIRYEVPPGGGGAPTVSVGPSDWLDLLNAGALISGSARKGRISIFSDIMYLSLTSKNDGRLLSVDDTLTVPGTGIPIPVGVDLSLNTRTDVDGLLFTLLGGYSLVDTERWSLDVFGGARLFSADVGSSWELSAAITTPAGEVVLPSQGSIGRDDDLWDGIVGIRGHTGVGDGKWSIPFYVDLGTGDTDLTWQVMTGVAYETGWGDLLLMYRHLEYDQGSDKFLQDFSLGGPVFGARFRF